MYQKPFPVIDMIETGKNIVRLREERGHDCSGLQAHFGFETTSQLQVVARKEPAYR